MEITAMPRLPRRAREAHKGDFGRVHIIAGSVGYTGAPVLAAMGAARSGAGLVSAAVPERVYPIVAARLLSSMPVPLPGPDRLTEESFHAALESCRGKDGVVLGPGLGSDPFTLSCIRRLIGAVDAPLTLDADGINALRGHIDVLDRRRDKVTVLTPHMGEFSRLLDREVKDREGEGAAFARAHGCILVLKGHETLTCYPDGRIYVNQTGNPGMAKGGSGDVLAGLLGGFLAQGLPPEWAVYLHGRAGDLAALALGEYAMTPGDLLDYLPAAMMEAERG